MLDTGAVIVQLQVNGLGFRVEGLGLRGIPFEQSAASVAKRLV